MTQTNNLNDDRCILPLIGFGCLFCAITGACLWAVITCHVLAPIFPLLLSVAMLPFIGYALQHQIFDDYSNLSTRINCSL